ncbi:hypothetical protein Cob_v003736 [Colletotrichum orbiculare MAFF 240422]|uniref:Uncharacterized protein n=1 Tax=Colletotrichum orbiculare (strain 104-T / ATCC 96160 / CBS 514.97 / LARS 414 / MAFF 240422) TaxID=1213857 RepID=A0A484FYV3_COLOR|nr:hypothetical protein Cob_v003736 [Colletotrichum orbiculare MAFF 240422]
MEGNTLSLHEYNFWQLQRNGAVRRARESHIHLLPPSASMNDVDVGARAHLGLGLGLGLSLGGSMPDLKEAYTLAERKNGSGGGSGSGLSPLLRSTPSPDYELHGSVVRDIIRARREERRARLQQRCRTPTAEATLAVPSASANRNITPLRRTSESSIKPDSPRSVTSSEFSSCVSPLMEDLMLEVTDAIESSGPEGAMVPSRMNAAFDMDDMFRLIEEARREYEALGETNEHQWRGDITYEQPRWMREECWGRV